MSKKSKKPILGIFILILFLSGIALGFFFRSSPLPFKKDQSQEKDPYTAFVTEVYDKIQENYWDEITDEKLSTLFKLAMEKVLDAPQVLEGQNKDAVLSLIKSSIKDKSDEEKKEFCASVSDVVLANLEPFGRSRLYTTKKEQELKNRVENVDPNTDQYQVLGLNKDATQDQIQKTFAEVEETLKEDDSEEAQQKLQQAQKAYDTLKDEEFRKNYNQSGVETSIAYELVDPKILHLHIKQFTPTTFNELQTITEKFDQGDQLDTLILDLRDNVGGAIDGLPYFLGPFIGQDQYAYQFYHQGDRPDFKTKIGWLPSLIRYKKVVVLINEKAQSSAEVMAAALKRYNVGVVLGTTTSGWGTVEKVFSLDSQLDPNETYSMFLVHSLTLKEDNQPIEGTGVTPTIDISSPDWKEQLNSYYNYPKLTSVIEEIWQEDL